ASLVVLPSASSKTASVRLTPSRTRLCYVFLTVLDHRTYLLRVHIMKSFKSHSHSSSFNNRRYTALLSNSFEPSLKILVIFFIFGNWFILFFRDFQYMFPRFHLINKFFAFQMDSYVFFIQLIN